MTDFTHHLPQPCKTSLEARKIMEEAAATLQRARALLEKAQNEDRLYGGGLTAAEGRAIQYIGDAIKGLAQHTQAMLRRDDDLLVAFRQAEAERRLLQGHN